MSLVFCHMHWGRCGGVPASHVVRHRRSLIGAGSPTGDLLLSGGRDATIRVWDLDTCCCRRTLPGHTADVLNMSALAPGLSWNGNAADCCPTGRGSVDADSDGDGAVGEAIAGRADRIPAHGGALLLASCSADGSCRLWDVQTWTCVHAIVPGTGVWRLPCAVLCLGGRVRVH